MDIQDFNLNDDEDFNKYLIIQQFYEGVFDDISYFFHKKIKEIRDEFVEKMQEDLANEIYYTKKLKEVESHVDILKIFNKFYFKMGRFPGNHFHLMIVPPGVKPSFVKYHLVKSTKNFKRDQVTD